MLPFLKWAGGKRWLLPLSRAMKDLEISTYYEPFLGSGAMFFGAIPQRAVLSDTNAELIGTYKAIAADWKTVEKLLAEHDRQHCKEHYYAVRSSSPSSSAERAARFIYLNRVCWNGLYRVNRQGVFNVPLGSKTSAVLDSDNFAATARLLQGAKLLVTDFEAPIDLAGPGDLIFADPPYTVRHQHNGFVKYNEQLFSWADQIRLHAALIRAKDRGAVVLCTNADHESVRELYSDGFRILGMNRFSSISGKGGTRGKYAEIMAVG